MPTKRASATAVCTESALIVVGGRVDLHSVAGPVEVMNTTTHQWSIASFVPSKSNLQCASGIICGDQLYVLGAINSKLAYSCSLLDLLQSNRPASELEFKTPQTLPNIWRRLADLPLLNSTCVSLCDHLIAIGGEDTDYSKPSRRPRTAHGSEEGNKTLIYAYEPTIKSWEVISQMSVARRLCFAVTLPTTNELMVVGGKEPIGDFGIDSVEFASMQI